jgi:hypothetical protein
MVFVMNPVSLPTTQSSLASSASFLFAGARPCSARDVLHHQGECKVGPLRSRLQPLQLRGHLQAELAEHSQGILAGPVLVAHATVDASGARV